MSGHYRRGDPESGCGLMILIAIVVVALVAGFLIQGVWP